VQNLLPSSLLYKNVKVVISYECETWLLTLREERRLRVSENRVLWRILGPKMEEVTGEWRKVHKKELNGLYSHILFE